MIYGYHGISGVVDLFFPKQIDFRTSWREADFPFTFGSSSMSKFYMNQDKSHCL